MEQHHVTVDKGLKMKIKKKKCENAANEAQLPEPIIESHLQPHTSARYNPTLLPSDKFQESRQARKDRHKHEKSMMKHGQNNFSSQRYESSFMHRPMMMNRKEKNSREGQERPIYDSSQGARDGGQRPGPDSGRDGPYLPLLVKQEPTFRSSNSSDKSLFPHDPYEFNSRDDEKESICSQGGLLAGLSAMKLKTEKPSHPNHILTQMEDDTKDSAAKDSAVETSSVGVVTDPDCLGPCEPGTSVVLEGIVWNETENGILVVNVTWRGKTYVGTLMDATRHDWAPPRFSCDSPVSDFESKTPKGRGKRSRLGNTPPVSEPPDNGRRLRQCRRNATATTTQGNPPVSPAKHANGKRKPLLEEIAKARLKRTKTHSKASPLPGVEMIECPEPDCGKKYKHINGLRYHQSHAHKDAPEFGSESQAGECEDFEPVMDDKASASKEVNNVVGVPPKPGFADMGTPRDVPIDTDKMDTSCDHEVANLNGCLTNLNSKLEITDSHSEGAKEISSEPAPSPAVSKDTETTPQDNSEIPKDGGWADKKKDPTPEAASGSSSPSQTDKASPPPSIRRYASPIQFTVASPVVAGASCPRPTATRTTTEEAHSPAYSDISDANEGAPLLENETENDSSKLKHKEKYDESSSDHSGPEAPLVSGYGMFGAYYGQPPYLTPAVIPENISRNTKTSSFEKASKSGTVSSPGPVCVEPEKPAEKSFPLDQPSRPPYGPDVYPRYPYAMKPVNLSHPSKEVEKDKFSDKRSDKFFDKRNNDGAKIMDKEEKSSKMSTGSFKESQSHQSPLNKSGDGTFQILKENMKLKEQLRENVPDKNIKEEVQFLGKSSSDFKRYYPSHQHVGPPGIMDSRKNATRYPGDDVTEALPPRTVECDPKEAKARSVIKSPGGEAFHGKEGGKEKGPVLVGSQKRPGHPPGVPSPAMCQSSYPAPFYPTSYPAYVNSIPYDSGHPMMMSGYPSGPPFMPPHHPMRFHSGSNTGKPGSGSDNKNMNLLEQHAGYYSGSPGQHREHREPVTKSPRICLGEGKEAGSGVVSGGERSADGKDSRSSTPTSEHSGRDEPPVQRHLHSHHHTHVVGPAYPLYGPYGSIL